MTDFGQLVRISCSVPLMWLACGVGVYETAGMSELKRTLNLPMLVFYGTGVILGAGIYSIIGKAAGPSGDTLWMSFVIAAISVTLTALSYAELSAMFPRAGAEYIYLTNAFPKYHWIGSSVGLAMAFSGAATAAAVALAFSGYLEQLISITPIFISLLLLISFTILSILGIQVSAWANVFFTLIEVVGLGLIIYLGFQSETFGDALSSVPHLGSPPPWHSFRGGPCCFFFFWF